MLPVVRGLRAEWDGLISIDTSKAEVAEAALAAGADIVNDVTGLRGDPEMAGLCRDAGCGVVVMHMQGEPRTMQLASALRRRGGRGRGTSCASGSMRWWRPGSPRECLCFDPGIGFGKTLEHNLELLRELDRLAPAGRPLLLGVSRKSFIGMRARR